MPSTHTHPAGNAVRSLGSVTSRSLLGSLVRLDVSVPGWRAAQPGQFAMLQADPTSCFLPRAFSIADSADDAVSFLIAPIGVGTNEISGLEPGRNVWVTGPLGHGFDIAALVGPPRPRVVVVGGGVGVAPFPLLLRRLGEEPDVAGLEVVTLSGFRDAGQAEGGVVLEAATEALAAAGASVKSEVSCEDGSRGSALKVTDLLDKVLHPSDRVVSCGPSAMLEAVWALCRERGVSHVWVSLETVMACGIGACHGCAITMADGSMARVCRDGPVFEAGEVYG